MQWPLQALIQRITITNMKNLTPVELNHVSGGITDEVLLVSLAVGSFVFLAAAIAVISYDYTYNDTSWGGYLMPYSYYPGYYGYYGYYDHYL